jgi:hypothetical protein
MLRSTGVGVGEVLGGGLLWSIPLVSALALASGRTAGRSGPFQIRPETATTATSTATMVVTTIQRATRGLGTGRAAVMESGAPRPGSAAVSTDQDAPSQ